MILRSSALYGPVAPIWDSWYVVIVLSIMLGGMMSNIIFVEVQQS